MATVFLALGSNLGEREDNIREALSQLETRGVTIVACSQVRETEPVGFLEQPKFLNAVCRAETILTPHQLLDACQQVETALGRVRSFPNAPRTVDVDILLYDNIRMAEERLTLPHPRMWERSFVVEPLEEIAPEIIQAHHAHPDVS